MRSRSVLAGPRGWGLVGALSAALLGTVAVQLPASAGSLDGRSAAGTTLGPAVPAPAGSAPVSAPAVAPVPRPATAGPTTTRPATARPVPVRPAAARPAAARPAPVRPAATRSTAAVCSGTGWQQRRGAAALSSLRPAPSPARTLVFRTGRSGFLGLTHMDSRVVEVFVRSCGSESNALLRHVVAHELGHAYDRAHLTPALRAAWLQARGIPAGTSWQGCDRCTDFATPAGDFAETYAQWRRGTSDSRTRIARVPGPAALDRLAATFFTR